MVAKWLKNRLKNWSNCTDSPYTEQYAMGISPLSRAIRHQFSNKYCRFSVPKHNMESGYLSPAKNCIFSIDLCDEWFVIWSTFLAIFQSFYNHKIFAGLNLPIFLVLVRQRKKSQKYFNLSSFDWNFNHSNLWSTLGAMNFKKWELLSGSPVGLESFNTLKSNVHLILLNDWIDRREL